MILSSQQMIKFIKKTSSQISASIKFLITPSSWVKGYQEGKEKFPYLKTLVMDDIDVQKIAEFMTKDRKSQEVYKMITIIELLIAIIMIIADDDKRMTNEYAKRAFNHRGR